MSLFLIDEKIQRRQFLFHFDFLRKEQECEELQYKVNVLSEALIRVNEIAQGVRNYLTCPSPRDVRYEMDLILSKVKECNIESNKDDN